LLAKHCILQQQIGTAHLAKLCTVAKPDVRSPASQAPLTATADVHSPASQALHCFTTHTIYI